MTLTQKLLIKQTCDFVNAVGGRPIQYLEHVFVAKAVATEPRCIPNEISQIAD